MTRSDMRDVFQKVWDFEKKYAGLGGRRRPDQRQAPDGLPAVLTIRPLPFYLGTGRRLFPVVTKSGLTGNPTTMITTRCHSETSGLA
jgi:hypothetical protein